MAETNAKAGDVVELKDKEAGFTDPITGFDISRDQKLELADPIGARTQEAIVSGGLLIVTGSKAKSEAAADKKAEEQATADAADAATGPTTVAVLDTGNAPKKRR